MERRAAARPAEKTHAEGRSTSVDIAKGLGIALVVLGHNWIVLHDAGELYRVIYSFHMPLFFFLSGVFLSPHKSFAATLKQRADSLLKPYLVVLLLLGAYSMLAARQLSFDYLIGMVYATGSSLLWIPLWFLPNLFVALLISLMLIKLPFFGDDRRRLIPLIALLLLIGVPLLRMGHGYAPMMLELLPGYWRRITGLPWSLDLLAINTAFLLAGYLGADHVRSPGRAAPAMTLAAGALFVLLHFSFNRTLDINERLYDSTLINSLEAFAGIYLAVGLSGLLSRHARLAAPLAYLGMASLFIFIFHAVIQGRFTHFFQKHLVGAPDLGAALGFMAGVAGPIVIYEICRRSSLLSALLLPRRDRIARTRPADDRRASV